MRCKRRGQGQEREEEGKHTIDRIRAKVKTDGEMVQEERKGAGGGRAAELVVYKEGRRLKEMVVKGESDSYYSRGKGELPG